MVTWLVFLLAIGADVRLTLLITRDAFPPVIWFRARVLQWSYRRMDLDGQQPDDTWAYTLITCPWCLSFWIALPCLAAARYAGHTDVFLIVAGALTASLAAGVTAHRIDQGV